MPLVRRLHVKTPEAEVSVIPDFGSLGALSGPLASFLLSTLQEKSRLAYRQVLADFKTELEARSVPWKELSSPERDVWLAEWTFEQMEASELPRQHFVLLATALHKISPGVRFHITWKALDAWALRTPARQAPAMPKELAVAVAVLCVVCGQEAVGTAVMLAFRAVLRISEAFFWRRDVICTGSAFVLVLGRTKKGLLQQVVIEEPSCVAWLSNYIGRHYGGQNDLLFNVSYSKVSYWLSRCCAVFGLAEVHFTTHSLRRGGATELLRLGWRVEDICVYGRWQSLSSARLYLQRGEVFLIRFRGGQIKCNWGTITDIAKLGASVWRVPAVRSRPEGMRTLLASSSTKF